VLKALVDVIAWPHHLRVTFRVIVNHARLIGAAAGDFARKSYGTVPLTTVEFAAPAVEHTAM
jgi:hypothetical protein